MRLRCLEWPIGPYPGLIEMAAAIEGQPGHPRHSKDGRLSGRIGMTIDQALLHQSINTARNDSPKGKLFDCAPAQFFHSSRGM